MKKRFSKTQIVVQQELGEKSDFVVGDDERAQQLRGAIQTGEELNWTLRPDQNTFRPVEDPSVRSARGAASAAAASEAAASEAGSEGSEPAAPGSEVAGNGEILTGVVGEGVLAKVNNTSTSYLTSRDFRVEAYREMFVRVTAFPNGCPDHPGAEILYSNIHQALLALAGHPCSDREERPPSLRARDDDLRCPSAASRRRFRAR